MMAKNDKEFEIQGNVEHLDKVLEYLAENGEFKGKKRLIDKYFVPSHRDFLAKKPVEEWLRLRDVEGKQSMTYKRWHYNQKNEGLFADEFESKVESVGQIQKMLDVLNFSNILVLDKTRSVWNCGEYEVAIDEVVGLEPMVEVEYMGEDDDFASVKLLMIEFLKAAGSGKVRINYSGIPIIMLFPDEVKYVEV